MTQSGRSEIGMSSRSVSVDVVDSEAVESPDRGRCASSTGSDLGGSSLVGGFVVNWYLDTMGGRGRVFSGDLR